MSHLSMRLREMGVLRRALDTGHGAQARAAVRRLVALYPLDPEVRLLAAREALARQALLAAGAHLLLVPEDFPGRPDEADRAVGEFLRLVERDPLQAFLALELRDVPEPEQLPDGVRGYVQGLLDVLAGKGYPRGRLEALLYERRRRPGTLDRSLMAGCLLLTGLVLVGLLALLVRGILTLW